MGYWIYQRAVDFRLPRRYHAVALRAMHTLNKGYTWVRTDAVMDTLTIADALREWRWNPAFDGDGDIVAIEHNAWKISQYEDLFEAIAPFVTAGSSVHIEGEDGTRWHYAFDGLHADVITDALAEGETDYAPPTTRPMAMKGHGLLVTARQLTWLPQLADIVIPPKADAWQQAVMTAMLAAQPLRCALLGRSLSTLRDPVLAITLLERLFFADEHIQHIAAANVALGMGDAMPVESMVTWLTQCSAGATLGLLWAIAIQPHRVPTTALLPLLDHTDSDVVIYAADLVASQGSAEMSSRVTAIRAQWPEFDRSPVSTSLDFALPALRQQVATVQQHIAMMAIVTLGMPIAPHHWPLIFTTSNPYDVLIAKRLRERTDRATFASLVTFVQATPDENHAWLIGRAQSMGMPAELGYDFMADERPAIQAAGITLASALLTPDEVLAQLASPAGGVREATLKVVTARPGIVPLAVVTPLLADPEPRVAAAAQNTILSADATIDTATLLCWLDDAHEIRRSLAFILLSRHPTPAVVERLQTQLRDEALTPSLLIALKTIAALLDPDLIRDKLLYHRHNFSEFWNLIEVAGLMGARAPVTTLVELIQDEQIDHYSRARIGEALGKLAGTHELVLATIVTLRHNAATRTLVEGAVYDLPAEERDAHVRECFPPSWNMLHILNREPTLHPMPTAALLSWPVEDIDDELREEYAKALGHADDPSVAPRLFAILGMPGMYGRQGATAALLALAPRLPAALLLTMAQAPLSWQRNVALLCLGQQRNPDHLPSLLAAMGDGGTRAAAIEALAGWDDARSMPIVLRYAHDPDNQIRRAVMIYLEAAETPAPPAILMAGIVDEVIWVTDQALGAARKLTAAQREQLGADATHVLAGNEAPPQGLFAAIMHLHTLSMLPLLSAMDDAMWDEVRQALASPYWPLQMRARQVLPALPPPADILAQIALDDEGVAGIAL